MKKIIGSIISLCFAVNAWSQGTLDDYNRAYSLRELYSSNNVLNSGVVPHFINGTSKFWYKTRRESGEVYVVVDPVKKLKKQQSDTSGLNIPQENNWWTDNSETHFWSETWDERNSEPVTSPDGNFSASIYGNNLIVKNLKDNSVKQLTYDGCEWFYYSSVILWSPDSKKIAVKKIQQVPKSYIYYVESCPKDQFQPKLIKQEYQKPGDQLAQKFPYIFDIQTGKSVTVDKNLIENQYDIDNFEWNSDSETLFFEYNKRGHQVYSLISLDINGKSKTIINEKSDKYINWTRLWRYHFDDGKRLLWTSERDNYNHIYLYDKISGNQICQVTKGEFYVREIQDVDEKNGVIYFSANGKNQNEDPYFIHYYKIGLDGKNLVELTPESAMHKAWLSPDHKFMIDVYSTVSNPPVAVLRSLSDGKIIMQLEKADISKLISNGWKAPEPFAAAGRDGKTQMWGLIFRPSNYDKSKKYPVIEYIYSGPGDQYVPKNFISYNWFMTSLAELGFIVVQVDGMTTSFRTKEFEEVCYKNLKDAGFEDHKRWILAAAEKFGDMDTSRIGIFGCSAGGQEALSNLLLHPDFYKCAYSACGCHDNRMDKIWWNEQWLGYPIDKSYLEGSNIENAHLLCRPLMLVWGELDDNVDPASSMKVVDALIKADKDFEMYIIPGAHHTMGEAFGEHKRYDFFVKHLLGVNPPKWSEVKK